MQPGTVTINSEGHLRKKPKIILLRKLCFARLVLTGFIRWFFWLGTFRFMLVSTLGVVFAIPESYRGVVPCPDLDLQGGRPPFYGI